MCSDDLFAQAAVEEAERDGRPPETSLELRRGAGRVQDVSAAAEQDAWLRVARVRADRADAVRVHVHPVAAHHARQVRLLAAHAVARVPARQDGSAASLGQVLAVRRAAGLCKRC